MVHTADRQIVRDRRRDGLQDLARELVDVELEDCAAHPAEPVPSAAPHRREAASVALAHDVGVGIAR